MSEIKKKKRYAKHILDLMDYDYYNKLNDQEKEFLSQFSDEYYNAKYEKKETSVFYSQDALNNIKKDKKKYKEFKQAFDSVKKTNKNITELDFLHNEMQKESSRNKYARSPKKEVFSRISYGHTVDVEDENHWEIVMESAINTSKLDDDQKELCYYLRNFQVEIYIVKKMTEIFEENNYTTDKIEGIQKEFNAVIEDYRKFKILKSDMFEYFYKVFAAVKLLYKHKNVAIIQNIFDMVIYNNNKQKMISLNNLKGE